MEKGHFTPESSHVLWSLPDGVPTILLNSVYGYLSSASMPELQWLSW